MLFIETRNRLDRCINLLIEMEKNKKNPDKFDTFLESFIERARSITWILQKEYKTKFPNLDNWYKEKQLEMSSSKNSLLKFFLQARNISTKEKNLDIHSISKYNKLFYEPPEGWIYRLTGRGESILVKNPNTPDETIIQLPKAMEYMNMLHFIEEEGLDFELLLNGKNYGAFDAITLCKLYYSFLCARAHSIKRLLLSLARDIN